MMDKRRTLRMQDEVIEEYSRPFPGEVVETYTRPLPASMAPAKPQAAKNRSGAAGGAFCFCW